MTDDDQDRLARLETVEGRSVWKRRLGIAVLVLIVLGVTAGFAVLLSISAENNRILEESEAGRAESDRAAVDVAQEHQDQARSVSELCESGEVDQDTERGRRVCEEARESATKDPAEQVQVAKGERGPAGADGRGISDLQCGEDGRWDVTYTDGEVEDGGVCREVATDDPEPEPTDPPEATEPESNDPPPQAAPTIREQESAEIWPPAAPTV